MGKIYLWILLMFFFFCPSPTMAQKKEIAAAKDQVKSGKNLDKAQQSMEKLLKDSANRDNKKIWTVLYDAVAKQYEQGNEKLYLKQKYDTAQLFNLTRQLFLIASGLDSVEMIPNKKGKLEIEYRKSHAEYLNQIRRNLYSGGMWLVRKRKHNEAYQFFDTYINTATMPLFKGYDYQHQDKLLPVAAYWAVYCGYKMQDPKATLHHSYEALKDTTHYDYMLQYLAETYKLEKDTVRYVRTLQEGFAHAPKFAFFFPRLVEHYVHENQLDSAMQVVDKALSIDAENELYLFTKGTLLLNQGKNKECAAISEGLIAKKTELPEVYYNAGLAYFNMAVEIDKDPKQSRKRHQEVLDNYQKARPFLEEYRKLQPQQQDQWALPLYTIYLNLNMGKEFDEIDKLLGGKK